MPGASEQESLNGERNPYLADSNCTRLSLLREPLSNEKPLNTKIRDIFCLAMIGLVRMRYSDFVAFLLD